MERNNIVYQHLLRTCRSDLSESTNQSQPKSPSVDDEEKKHRVSKCRLLASNAALSAGKSKRLPRNVRKAALQIQVVKPVAIFSYRCTATKQQTILTFERMLRQPCRCSAACPPISCYTTTEPKITLMQFLQPTVFTTVESRKARSTKTSAAVVTFSDKRRRAD